MISKIQRQLSPPSVAPTQMTPSYKIHFPPFPKWDGTPMTKPLLLAHFVTYKYKAYYVSVQDWTKTTTATKYPSVAISAHILSSLPRAISSMFLNDPGFASDGIPMLSYLLTHLNPSSSKNLLLAISDLTCLEMGVG